MMQKRSLFLLFIYFFCIFDFRIFVINAAKRDIYITKCQFELPIFDNVDVLYLDSPTMRVVVFTRICTYIRRRYFRRVDNLFF